MTTNTTLDRKYVADYFEISLEEVNEWVEDDFEFDGKELPTTDELISHIEYQLLLSDCCDTADATGLPFDNVWAEAVGLL